MAAVQESKGSVNLLITQRGSSDGDAAHGRPDISNVRWRLSGRLGGPRLALSTSMLYALTYFAGALIPFGDVLADVE